MAYEKGSRPEGGFKRRGPARRRKKVWFPREVRSSREESQETVQSIRER